MNAGSQRRRVYLKIMASLSALLLLAPASSGQQPRSSTQEPVIRQHTTLVTVNVTVMDQFNRQITGLDRDRFEVYEDKVRQKIDFFSDEDTPLSIGIIFDLSGSMKYKLSRAREALKAFIETSHDEDDFFLVGFNQRASLLSGFSGGETIINKLTLVDPNGQTALFDAAYLGVEKAREGRHDKRALLVISDGQDNSSRYSYGELSRLLKESDVQIYCIGIGEEGGAAFLTGRARRFSKRLRTRRAGWPSFRIRGKNSKTPSRASRWCCAISTASAMSRSTKSAMANGGR